MGRLAVLLLLASAAALLPAADADAYKLFKHRWYSKTLTYYDATGGKYRNEIRAAASVLNRSGARVRVRSASRRTARVQIRIQRNLRSAGQARYVSRNGIVRNAKILLRDDLAKSWNVPIASTTGIIAVVAHEMAHVLGLNHENRRCATMNSVLWSHCTAPPVQWQYRCRVLERDDVRGLVRRFGGRARSVGPDLCPAEEAPAAPAAIAATGDPATGAVGINWTEGALPVARAEVLRGAGVCPTGSGDPAATLVARIESAPGRPNTVNDVPGAPGTYCYAVVGLGALGRPGAVATATVNYLGYAPRASFTGSWTSGGTVLQLRDLSTDPDGQIVAWSWNFGDGTTSAERNPRKGWSRAATYTVTLTVTDNTGQTGTFSQPVVIQPGSNRGTLGH